MVDWKHGTRPSSGAAGEKGSAAGTILLVAGGLAAVGGIVAFLLVVKPKIDRHRMVNQHGEARGSLVTGNLVAVFDSVSIDHEDRDDHTRNHTQAATRVTTFDALSGDRIAQELIDGFGGCVVATPERVWCDFARGGELALYEARTFKRVRAFGDLVLEAKLGKLVPGRWRVDGASAYQMLDDGRVAVVDGAAPTPVARREDKVPAELRDQGPLQMTPTKGSLHMTDDCGARDALAADMMKTSNVTSADFMPGAAPKKKDKPKGRTVERGQGPRSHVVQDGVASRETYLSPVWVRGDAPLLLHHTSVNEQDDKVQLSKLTPAGTAAWTAEIGRGCEQVVAHGKLVVVTTKDPKRRVVGIDADNGAIRYTAGF